MAGGHRRSENRQQPSDIERPLPAGRSHRLPTFPRSLSDRSIFGDVQHRLTTRSSEGRTGIGAENTLSHLSELTKRHVRLPFVMLVTGAVSASLLLICTMLVVPEEYMIRDFKTATMRSLNETLQRQGRLGMTKANATANLVYGSLLDGIVTDVGKSVKSMPINAVLGLAGYLQTLHQQGMDPTDVDFVWRYCWVDLKLERPGRPYSVYASFTNGRFAGVAVNDSGYTAWLSQYTSGQPTQTLQYWSMDSLGNLVWLTKEEEYCASCRVWYQLQANLRRREPQARAQLLWTNVFFFLDGMFGITLTYPVTFCGNYSCFEGVIAADVTLGNIKDVCHMAWLKLQSIAEMPAFMSRLEHNSSAVFIVQHFKVHDESEQGVLIGDSTPWSFRPNTKTYANESLSAITRETAAAILWYFGDWDQINLPPDHDSMIFTFKKRNNSNGQDGDFEGCGNSWHAECYRVGVHVVSLSHDTRWLVVLVLQAGAWSRNAFEAAENVANNAQKMSTDMEFAINNLTLNSCLTFGIITVISLCLSVCVGERIAHPLTRLSKLLRKLSKLKFSHTSVEFQELVSGRRSRVQEIAVLQDEFAQLSKGVESFGHFVPEAVVRNIVSGELRATRLHVKKGKVTIMFSEIRDFTRITEQLSEEDIVVLLTLYFTKMTDVIEEYEGVVSEVLQDGLLAVWNTPDPVEDHPGQACRAALAQQQAVHSLNAELRERALPQLRIRMGLNTGDVLTGNIGCVTRMRFGCMGDPVNVASRLAGLCKMYGVGVVCSGELRAMLLPDAGILFRQLDLVQVKGRDQPVAVYEIIGSEFAPFQPHPGLLADARLYEEALRAYQQARFPQACQLFAALHSRRPDDEACERFLECARKHVGPDGISIVGLTPAQLQSWTGLSSLTTK